jgi:lipopolysaccharide/colanic/teichoic acid biosynthesis glycosyltransferase
VARPNPRHTLRKRCFDLVVGGVLALVALPIIFAFAIGIAISLRCWPFFAHSRPGCNGRPITMIKLRTLPPSTPTYADKRDLHIEGMPLPWLCRVLRQTHLDELPQLLLVVQGKMSLVGPRPGQDPLLEGFNEDFNARRTSVRPGCTGLWQIGSGADGSIAESPHFDLFYLDRSSMRLDIWVLLRTVPRLCGLAKPIELRDIPKWLLATPRPIVWVPDHAVASDSVQETAELLTYPSDGPQQRVPLNGVEVALAD